MIRDQDSILDHLQPSKLLDIWMYTQMSRATLVSEFGLDVHIIIKRYVCDIII